MRVLVTGAGGFIGRALTLALLRKGVLVGSPRYTLEVHFKSYAATLRRDIALR